MKRLGLLGIPALVVGLALVSARASAGPRVSFTAPTPTMKILVDADGWYRVPKATLEGNGFVMPDNPNLLHLRMNAQDVPFQLHNGALEFYGQGIDTNTTEHLYANARTYYLSLEGTEPTPMQFARARGTASATATAGSFQTQLVIRVRKFYYAALQSHNRPGVALGNNFFGDYFGPATPPPSRTINLSNVDLGQPGALRVDLYGFTPGNSRTVNVTLNGTSLGSIPGNGQAPMGQTFSGLTTITNANTLELSDSAVSGDGVLQDAITLTYQHLYKADANVLDLPVSGGQAVSIGGFTSSNVRLLDISNPQAPKELFPTVTNAGDGTFTISIASPATATRLYAFADSATLAPKAGNVFVDTPSTLKSPGSTTPANSADLIVITHKDFKSAVQPLVDRRVLEGMRVKLVDIEDVYDEFSNPLGAKDPAAITSFLHYAYDNWTNPDPRYVLLVGDGSSDPRGYRNVGTKDFLPTAFFDSAELEYPSDDAMADFLPGFDSHPRPEMAVGRLPVKTVAETTTVVNKILNYWNPGVVAARSKTALLVSDDFSRGDYHFDQFSTDLDSSSLTPNGVVVDRVDRTTAAYPDDIVAHNAVVAKASTGPTIVNWFGHGAFLQWNGSPALLSASDASYITNSSALSVYLMMTCQTGYFVNPFDTNLGETLLLATNAAVAVWASSGDTVPQDQITSAKISTNSLFGPSKKRLGDAMLDAKTSPLVTDDDVLRTWVLLGDPTMKLNI